VTAVPFGDFRAHLLPIRAEIDAALARVLDSGWFILGPEGEALERELAASFAARDAVAVANGTEAIQLALLALGIGAGDEVITSPLTAAFTGLAILATGARPAFADLDPATLNVAPEALRRAVTPRTKALLPVHLYGHPCDLEPMLELSRERGVTLIEDACQAHGAERDGTRAGVSGRAAAFSFYPGKNLGAFGDAGALTTNDDGLADVMRALREHGQRAKYEHEREGWTARLDTIQAIVLLAKLQRLDGWNEERRAIASHYLERLESVGDLELPPVARDSSPVWRLFVVRTADPGALADTLKERGIATGRHYPDAVHLTQAYRWLGYEQGAFPLAERHAERVLSLPIFPGMTIDDAEAVVAAVSAFFDSG